MARTRAQIKVDINSVQKQINANEEEKRRYQTSLSNAKKLVSNLTASLNNARQAQDNLKKYFTINGKTADGGKIEKVKTEINGIIRNINVTILPTINTKINSLNTKYRMLVNKKSSLESEYRSAES